MESGTQQDTLLQLQMSCNWKLNFLIPDSSRCDANGVGGAEGAEGAHHRNFSGGVRPGDDIGLEQFLHQLALGPRVHGRGRQLRQLGAPRGMLQLSHGEARSRNLRVKWDVLETYMSSETY